MPTVTVKPSGIRFAAELGQTVMAAGVAAGYRWPTICGGNGECLVCHVEVLERSEHLAPPSADEADKVSGLGRGPNIRLACQAAVSGDVVVLKRGVRRAKLAEESETDDR